MTLISLPSTVTFKFWSTFPVINPPWENDPLNEYLYDQESQNTDFFELETDNFFSTLAYAMDGEGDFFKEQTTIQKVENDPYGFYEAMFES